jgi:hypothetical protein
MSPSPQRLLGLALVVVFTSAAVSGGEAQSARARPNVDRLLMAIDQHAAQFRRTLSETPDREWIVRGETTRDIGSFVTRFTDATRRLNARADDARYEQDRVEEVLRRGISIDSFMEHRRSSDQSTRDWALVRLDLAALALAFDVPWNRTLLVHT